MIRVRLLPQFGDFRGLRRARNTRRLSVALWLLLVAEFAASALSASPQQAKPEEYQVKAVYLYNFGKFVDWPPAAAQGDSFAICVLGRDPFGPMLDTTLAGESIGDKKLVARRIATVQEASACRILFVSVSEAGRLKQILAGVEKSGVLTVSDAPDFMASGGMIQFVLSDNKVRFEVNLGAAEKAGLKFSSQLLKVATDVKKE